MNDSPSPSLKRVSPPEVILVFPVYNEGEILAEVVREWLDMLSGLSVSYRLLLCNDGSTDNTAEVLEELSHHRSLEIRHAHNRGHGPTLLRAYRSAAERAPWIFQCDSDGELSAADFPAFWNNRKDADLIIGTRENREGPWIRRAITGLLRISTRILFGKGIPDVNCPYRLMRSESFRPLLDRAPEDTFAPNVLISAFALRHRLRIQALPVVHTRRKTGEVSIRGRSLLNAVVKATRQTLAYRFSRSG